MGIFDIFSSKSSTTASTSTTQNTTNNSYDQKAAAESGIALSNSDLSVSEGFSDNALKAFTTLADIAAGALTLSAQTAQSSVSGLADVKATSTQGADNTTIIKTVPWVAAAAAVAVIFMSKGR